MDHATGAASTLTVLKNDVALAPAGTFAVDDMIEVTAAVGVSGCARFVVRVVGAT